MYSQEINLVYIADPLLNAETLGLVHKIAEEKHFHLLLTHGDLTTGPILKYPDGSYGVTTTLSKPGLGTLIFTQFF